MEKIKKKYVNEELRARYIEDIESVERWINEDVRQKIEAEGLQFTKDLLVLLTSGRSALQQVIGEKSRAYVKSLGFIPNEEKQRIMSSYDNVIERLTPIVDEFGRIMRQYRFDLQEFNGCIVFDESQKTERLKDIGVRIFTDEEVFYIEMLQELAEKVKVVREYEKKHDFVPYVAGMMSVSNGIIIGSSFVYDVSRDISIVDKFSKVSTLKKIGQIN